MKEVQLFALRKEFWKLKQLVSEGANVNDTSNEDNPARYSPLIFGAISGSADILILLIINGASINYQDSTGRSALHYASLLGYVDCVKVLLAAKGIEINLGDKDSSTPIQAAASLGGVECVDLLIANGADPNSCDSNYVTALHKASMFGFWDTTELLIKRGAKVDNTDINGASSLHYAVYNRHYKVVEVLLKYGASTALGDCFNRTPIIYAAATGDAKLTSMLLEYGVDVNWRSRAQRTALHLAASRGNVLICRLLIKKNADLNAVDEEGLTPLHCATQANRKGVVSYLLHKKAKIDAKDKNGMTPLHTAILYNSIDCALLLVYKNADVNTRNKFGMTALHTLFMRYRNDSNEYSDAPTVEEEDVEELFAVMLDHGANLDAPGPDDETIVTPRVIAKIKGININDISESINKDVLRNAVFELLSQNANDTALRFLQSKTHNALFDTKGEKELFKKTAKLSGSIGPIFNYLGVDLNARSLSDGIIRDAMIRPSGLESVVNLFRQLYLIPTGEAGIRFWKLVEMFVNRLVNNQKFTTVARISYEEFDYAYKVKNLDHTNDKFYAYFLEATEKGINIMFPPGIMYGEQSNVVYLDQSSPKTLPTTKSVANLTGTTNAPTPILPPPPINKKIGRAKCRKFLWDKMLNSEVPNSIFKSSNWKDIFVDPTLLLEHFVYYKPEKVDKSKEKKKKHPVRILDIQKASTIEIVLSKINVSHDVIFRSIIEMNFDILSFENFKAIFNQCPTEIEIRILREYKGEVEELCLADAFYARLARIPNLYKRLRATIAYKNFENQCKDLKEKYRVVLSYLKKIETNAALREFFITILAVGNYLNDGYIGGQAEGFKLHSVFQLHEFRTNPNVKYTKYNLLRHILKLTKDLSFLADLTGISKCTSEELAGLNHQFSKLLEEIKVVRELLENFEPAEKGDAFKLRMQPFLSKMDGLTKDIQKQMTEVDVIKKELQLFFGETSEDSIDLLISFFQIISNERRKMESDEQEIKEELHRVKNAKEKKEKSQSKIEVNDASNSQLKSERSDSDLKKEKDTPTSKLRKEKKVAFSNEVSEIPSEPNHSILKKLGTEEKKPATLEKTVSKKSLVKLRSKAQILLNNS